MKLGKLCEKKKLSRKSNDCYLLIMCMPLAISYSILSMVLKVTPDIFTWTYVSFDFRKMSDETSRNMKWNSLRIFRTIDGASGWIRKEMISYISNCQAKNKIFNTKRTHIHDSIFGKEDLVEWLILFMFVKIHDDKDFRIKSGQLCLRLWPFESNNKTIFLSSLFETKVRLLCVSWSK